MNDNPYEPPTAKTQAIEVEAGPVIDLYGVAIYQKAIILIVAVTLIGGFFLTTGDASQESLSSSIAILIVGLVSMIFVFMLAMKLYGVWIGVLCGVLSFIPCAGLVVLLVLVVNATRVLKANGVEVGFLGVPSSVITELKEEKTLAG